MDKETYYKEQLSSMKDVLIRTTDYMDELQNELSKSKAALEQKHEEILQSISYAATLQKKLVPDKSLFKDHFSEHYMVIKQRDKIGGDFIYAKEKDDLIYFGLMDSTGHGIPGAIISVLGYTFLEEILASEKSLSPADVCFYLDKKIARVFERNQQSSAVQDGMDGVFCVFNPVSRALSYSCCGRPIWYRRNGQWKKVKSRREKIGGYGRSTFKSEEIILNQGDEIFLFSDGLTDQFGGIRDKKYLSKRVYSFLNNEKFATLEARLTELEKDHSRWMSQSFQTDDVAFLGLKI